MLKLSMFCYASLLLSLLFFKECFWCIILSIPFVYILLVFGITRLANGNALKNDSLK